MINFASVMKKILFTIVLMAATVGAMAQNLQVHYDFGKNIYSDEEGDRQNVTLTLEQFKADKLGSWYYFVDLDIDKAGMKGAYTEISREFNVAQASENSSFAAHVEYDGGLNRFGTFQTAALVGGAWNGHSSDFSKTYSVQLLYKQFFKHDNGNGFRYDAYSSLQLTGVWSLTFAQGACTFSGFMDFWRGEKADGHGQLVWLTEPQLWYNVNKNISFGTEIEMSSNFVYPACETTKSFYINPTIAAKFTF